MMYFIGTLYLCLSVESSLWEYCPHPVLSPSSTTLFHSYSNSEAVKRETKGRAGIQESPSRVLTLNEQEWQKLEQESVLKNVALAFDNSRLSDIDSDAGSETSEERAVGGDAQSLAALLQQQIDVINNELKWVMLLFIFTLNAWISAGALIEFS